MVSRLRRYQELFIGQYDFLSFLKYELIISSFGLMPGAVGLYLRSLFYRSLFRKIGENVIFGRNITLRHPGKMTLGSDVIVDDNCILDAKGTEKSAITIGNGVFISAFSILSMKDGVIEIGDNTRIGSHCRLETSTRLSVGRNVLIAYRCYVGAEYYHFERLDVPISQQGKDLQGGVIIEDNVWLGAGVVVLDGVTIGRDAIVGAGAVVTKDIPEFAIAYGVPARVVRKRTRGEGET
ncbi:maltose O-acetyltransferase [Candidatus Hakubella thermalkaliphila]|uniref:Maltose O-acetyltransferase n=2 Tax=Candidatus Hakubella thermalkaliphila TaxID=2754717 RepID=A0A6V8PJJ4_9ACTN|nr:acyltransferase [Candidatus Hakubella thermalkaliphila]MBT9171051.1 putative acetyltransferase [Actinomycetota bacterium]GFP26706.1 maltose O-acetyltransferase [Candidatus Hakubella thermalkaliphila]GFP32417.1 maltose O-acetyltransferase [Candidatus Hakubella thermalkaliphila]GFP43249.1 maltose O-acetyltransferase [Candidatus Hakubella thermalkaliphila]